MKRRANRLDVQVCRQGVVSHTIGILLPIDRGEAARLIWTDLRNAIRHCRANP